jgi:integrase
MNGAVMTIARYHAREFVKQELVDLRLDDISFDRATLWVTRLKGSNSGMHPIEGDELKAIRRYLEARQDNLPLALSFRTPRVANSVRS